MKQQDIQQLKKVIIERARVIQRPSAEQIQREKLCSQRLARFLKTRLAETGDTPKQLADHLDIEEEFITVLLEGTFPVSELNATLLAELAEHLKCTVNELRKAMLPDEIDDHHGGERKNPPKSHDAIFDAYLNHDCQQAIDLDD